jgi:hypothetical protein
MTRSVLLRAVFTRTGDSRTTRFRVRDSAARTWLQLDNSVC